MFESDITDPGIELCDEVRVRQIDPLQTDSFMFELADVIKAGDVKKVENKVIETAVYANETGVLEQGPTEATASLFNLDVLASAGYYLGLYRDGVPQELARALETAGAVGANAARATCSVLCIANPLGDRQRTFTLLPEEKTFYEVLRESHAPLDYSLQQWSNVTLESSNQTIGDSLELTREAIDTMNEGVARVHTEIPADVFTYQIKPFFEHLKINGKTLVASNASQLPFLALEYILFECDHEQLEGVDNLPPIAPYFESSLPYLSAKQLRYMTRFLNSSGGQSVNTIIDERGGDDFTELHESLMKLMQSIRVFRSNHYGKLVEPNFRLRSDEAVGSGGHNKPMLRALSAEANSRFIKLRMRKAA